MVRAAAVALGILAVGLCCWAVVRDTEQLTPEQVEAGRSFRAKVREFAGEVWGKEHVQLAGISGPEDALTLRLRVGEGHCAKPPIRLFILYTYSVIQSVATVTCNEPGKSVSVEVGPYLDKIRATFPMIPDKPDTEIEFGGTVTQMSRHSSLYKKAQFQSRPELIEHLQNDRDHALRHQFGTTPRLHKRGLKIYAAPHDDRILVIETVACDSIGYRIIHFSFDGLSKTTMVKWTELGGTFLVCKGERHLGVLGMQAAVESLGLHPVNSVAECLRRQTKRRCN